MDRDLDRQQQGGQQNRWFQDCSSGRRRLPARTADAVFESLRTQGVLIKNLNPAGGRLADCLRVTVGTPQENDVNIALHD